MNFYEVNIKILLENYTYVKNQSDKKIRKERNAIKFLLEEGRECVAETESSLLTSIHRTITRYFYNFILFISTIYFTNSKILKTLYCCRSLSIPFYLNDTRTTRISTQFIIIIQQLHC